MKHEATLAEIASWNVQILYHMNIELQHVIYVYKYAGAMLR
jgi:hypothetical protein